MINIVKPKRNKKTAKELVVGDIFEYDGCIYLVAEPLFSIDGDVRIYVVLHDVKDGSRDGCFRASNSNVFCKDDIFDVYENVTLTLE